MPTSFPNARTPVLSLRSILDGGPILFVAHDLDGGWRFFDDRSVFEGGEIVLAPLERLIQIDPGLQHLADLPAGWRAWRDAPTSPWIRESAERLEATRARTERLLDELERGRIRLPEGFPSTSELLREDRER